MNEFGVEEVHWPAQSTDPNPTEHLWDELEQDFGCLTNALLEEWSKFPINTRKHVENLRRNVETVITAEGGTTSY